MVVEMLVCVHDDGNGDVFYMKTSMSIVCGDRNICAICVVHVLFFFLIILSILCVFVWVFIWDYINKEFF